MNKNKTNKPVCDNFCCSQTDKQLCPCQRNAARLCPGSQFYFKSKEAVEKFKSPSLLHPAPLIPMAGP